MIIALIISIIIANLVYFFTAFYTFIGFDKALEGVMLFSSISLGFYGACLSVIASIFNTKVIKEIMKDNEEKTEFIILVALTLVSGFLTVVITIIYEVFLKNGGMSPKFYDLLSATWSGSVIMFISMNFIFVLVSFLILFNNKGDKEDDEREDKDSRETYNPILKTSPFDKTRNRKQ